MKKQYKITVPETHIAVWQVEADSEDDAKRQVRRKYKNDEGPDDLDYLTTDMDQSRWGLELVKNERK